MTETGLRERAEINKGSYSTEIKVLEEELASLRLLCDTFHGEWNYTILPRTLSTIQLLTRL